jgi:hypothetical protein
MQFDLNCITNTNMFVSFTVTNNTSIIAIIITLTFMVNIIDYENLTAIHFIGNSSNLETFAHNFWRN